MKINLVQAFKLRKRVTTALCNVTDILDDSSNLCTAIEDTGSSPEDTTKKHGYKMTQLLDVYKQATSKLLKLNQSIATSNVVASCCLEDIRSTDASTIVYKGLYDALKSMPKKTFFTNSVTGERTYIEQRPDISIEDVLATLHDLNVKKAKLEFELGSVNATTDIDLLDEDLDWLNNFSVEFAQ